jgi:murein L,D-transpeptidase YafK
VTLKAPGRAWLRATTAVAACLLSSIAAGATGVYQKTVETPEPGALDLRLAAKGMLAGQPVMIRIFKAESELEVWMRKSERFELLAIYDICNWSGSLGPKISEGDKQSPEGFYSVGAAQLHKKGRWPRSLDIGFPNTFDRTQERTGSYILVHGGCTTTGCYAMTNALMEEIYALSEAALQGGQERIPVHVFPFRMTSQNLKANAERPWHDFWSSLKTGYDYFERTRQPPQVAVCEKQYVVTEPGAARGRTQRAQGLRGGPRQSDCLATSPACKCPARPTQLTASTDTGRVVGERTNVLVRHTNHDTVHAGIDA